MVYNANHCYYGLVARVCQFKLVQVFIISSNFCSNVLKVGLKVWSFTDLYKGKKVNLKGDHKLKILQ